MAENSSASAPGTDPLSFFISNLYTGSGSVRLQQMGLERIDEENSSNRSSSYLTALPTWENARNSERHRIHIPQPLVLKRAHPRPESRDPILENDALSKEVGELNRSGSQRSIFKSRASTPTHDERPCHRRKLFWLVVFGVCLLSVVTILGAVLGVYLGPKHSDPIPTVTQIPAGSPPTPTVTVGGEEPSPSPSALSQIASVAVTGWSVPGSMGYNVMWLFWQNTEGYLSRAAYNSSTGNWTRVNNFVEAKRGTPLAATALNAEWYTDQENYTFMSTQYQANIAFIDGKNHLNEWIFPDTGPEIGRPGPLSQQKYTAREDSKIASYWPHLVYQGTSGEIRGAHYACHEKNECWHERVFSTTDARNGTHLVVTPMQNNLSSLGLFYQEKGGRMLVYTEDEDEIGALWENAAFSELIPSNASVAAFSTTRTTFPADPNLNNYLLWRDASDTIQMSWRDDDSGWKGPITYPAFAGAEHNTALACLTGLTFPNAPLQTGTELARCYFQTGRALREVSFDGDSWNIVGVVPIDF
ncbi:hypothetical protein K458DRAFT_418910 [Lentithecium fluviatile CBS 122367]|uniref:Fucose-specific lectin n=1 Tax=Lentithecium fluviatile CBS 122367 TaxID=1168545 RepID=A0A6G1IZ82_9PLEO|nr:hypothetical protein K458DRAFT_418910 [Lentithecium fluviatile CBS 122367]